MSRLNYKDILTRVSNRVGIENPTNYQRQSILLHIYDELIKIHAVTEDKRIITVKQPIFDGTPIETAPTVISTALPLEGSSGLSVGVYEYRFAYYNSLLGESSPIDSAQVEFFGVEDERIYVSGIPTKPFGVDSIKVYRSKVDLDGFYLHSTIDNDATAFYDNTPDASLGSAYITRTKYADEASISFPEDYFVLRQVTFYNEEGVVVLSQEAPTEEEFNRYKPSPIQENSDSFRTVVDGTVPFTSKITEENIRYDGAVLYTILDTVPPTFDYKVRFNGYLEWMYIAIPDITFADMTQNPELAYAFYDLLVSGATIRANKVRLVKGGLNEAEIAGITLVMRLDVADYKELLKKYAGYIKRTVDTHAVRGFRFLDDITMDIGL
jgi:hypothetical protein